MNNNKSIIKFVARIVTTVSVGVVTNNVIKHCTQNLKMNRVEKRLSRVGGFIIADMIATSAVDYVSATIDEAFSTWDECRKTIQLTNDGGDDNGEH